MKIEDLPLEQIALEDRTFDLGFARRYDELRASVAAVGVLQPLLVRHRRPAEGCQIVCGFGRAQVARDLKADPLPTRLLPPETTDADCLRLALFDNLPHRRFNAMERGIILAKLGQHVDRELLLRDYLPLVGLQPSGALLDRTLALLQLVGPVQRAVAEGRIEEKPAASLAALSSADQGAFVRLLERCRPSVSIVREWAELLADVSRRDGRSFVEILAAPAISAILDSAEMTETERASALRRRLHLLRYPTLAARETRFAAAKAALHLPPTMRLEPSPRFESDELRLEVRFRNEEALREALALLQSRLDDPTLVRELWKTMTNDGL